jgi:segregation and condensation protein B
MSAPSRKSRRKSNAHAEVVSIDAAQAAAAAASEAAGADETAEAAPADPKVQTGEHPVPRGDGRDEGDDEEGALGSEPHDEPAAASAESGTAAPELDRERVKNVLESVVFVSESVMTAVQLGRIVKLRMAVVRELMAELIAEYEPRGIQLVEVGSGYQFRSAARNAEAVRDFVAQRPVRLTRAQLETLALIGYRQPITRPEIDEVRGVDSGSAMRVLLERDLIKLLGRKDEPGRPLLYGTTPYFLEFFGLKTLKELPTLREFTELNEENRALFKRKTGEEVGEAEAALAAAEESARHDDEPSAHISDEDLAALAAQEDADRAAERDSSSLAPDADVAEEADGEAHAEAEL